MRAYDPDKMASHNVLVGRQLVVVVEKVPSKNYPDIRYSEVTEFYAVGRTGEAPIAATSTVKNLNADAIPAGAPSDDEIPF